MLKFSWFIYYTKTASFIHIQNIPEANDTDLTVHEQWYHPYTQKTVPFNALVHRLFNVPPSPVHYDEQVNTIKHIAISNLYKK